MGKRRLAISKVKVLVTLLLVWLLSIQNGISVFAGNGFQMLEEDILENPDYTYYESHKDEFSYGYVPPKVLFPVTESRGRRTRRSIDESYDARKEHIISSVKDQGQTGTCWAHATMASIETALLKKGEAESNFSEAHLAYNARKDINLDTGGNAPIAMAYFSRLDGPVKEEAYPKISEVIGTNQNHSFLNHSLMECYKKKNGEKYVGDMIIIGKSDIKKYVKQYGIVIGGYYDNEKYYFEIDGKKKGGYHIPILENHYVVNHDITIVGWDDKKQIPGATPGAYLVKNSWGTHFGQDGYFWISYDTFLDEITDVHGKRYPANYYVFTNVGEKKEKIYQYDSIGYAGHYTLNRDNVAFANEYIRDVKDDEVITDVAFYNLNPGDIDYKIYISEENDWEKEKETGTLIGQGELKHTGYCTIPISEKYILTKDKFVVKLVLSRLSDAKVAIARDYDSSGFSEVYNKSYLFNGSTYKKNKGDLSLNVITKKVPNVDAEIKKLEIIQEPTRKEYVEGEKLDLSGLKVKIIRSDLSEKEVNFEEFKDNDLTTNPVNQSELSTSDTEINITHTASKQSVKQKITVNMKQETEVRVTGIIIKQKPSKTEYTEGEMLDLNGLEVTLHKSDGTREDVALKDFENKGLETNPKNGKELSKADVQVNVVHKESQQSAVQKITVEEQPLLKIEVNSISIQNKPENVNYTEGENLDLSGLIIKLHKSNGIEEEVGLQQFKEKGIIVEPANGSKLSVSNAGVSITHMQSKHSVIQPIKVKEKQSIEVKVDSIHIQSGPSKGEYNEGEKLELNGLVVVLHKSDKSTEEVEFDKFASRGLITIPENGKKLALGENKVTITHKETGIQVEQTIIVNSKPSMPINVSFVDLKANGTLRVKTTTEINITLSSDIGLTIEDITLEGASKKQLTRQGEGVYRLDIEGITVSDGEDIFVSLTKNGYLFNPHKKRVPVYVADMDVPIIITGLEIQTPPRKVIYTEGETLDVGDMVILLKQSNGNNIAVPLEHFVEYGIEITPKHLSILNLNDTKVLITHSVSGRSVMQALVVKHKESNGGGSGTSNSNKKDKEKRDKRDKVDKKDKANSSFIIQTTPSVEKNKPQTSDMSEKEIEHKIVKKEAAILIVDGVEVNIPAERLKEFQKISSKGIRLNVKDIGKDEIKDRKNIVIRKDVLAFSITEQSGNEIKGIQNTGMMLSIPYKLKEKEDSSEINAYFLSESGGLTKIQNSYYDLNKKAVVVIVDKLSGKIVIGHKSPIKILAYDSRNIHFSDMDKHWAKSAVQQAVERGLFTGVKKNTFAPDAKMTRAMLFNALYKMSGENYPTGDVWYASGVNFVKAKGISDGSDPNGKITREQLVLMLYNYAGSPKIKGTLPFYRDSAKISSYAKEAFVWAIQNNYISGKPNNQLDPQGKATRAEVAVILIRYLEK